MIRLLDTMTRQKREFVPDDPNRVTMYVCGPTVYGRAHIGNARPAVIFDVLARLIRHEFGPSSLVYARNVTDIDDKIIAAAEAEGVAAAVVTERYERLYLQDMAALGVHPPTIAPHATQEVAAMVALISRLLELDHAYVASGHVLFSVASDPGYGSLSRRDREAMIAGARVEIAPYKRDSADFVLWKPSAAHVIGWESPWGRGRPGWHIECSAMIEAHLGQTIDIHGGGLDLIFPHHENESAQSRCAHLAPLARYWIHNGFVDMGSQKMSKSLGNIITAAQLLADGHRGETLRLALLSTHYHQPLAWTDKLVAQAKATLDRLYRNAGEVAPTNVDEGVLDALRDDLNTPLALARLSVLEGGTLRASAQLLGLLNDRAEDWAKGRAMSAGGVHEFGTDADGETNFEERIARRIAERTSAKANRDFAVADQIRNELRAEGIVLEDGPRGTTWRRE